jgi:hypothetical protein
MTPFGILSRFRIYLFYILLGFEDSDLGGVVDPRCKMQNQGGEPFCWTFRFSRD